MPFQRSLVLLPMLVSTVFAAMPAYADDLAKWSENMQHFGRKHCAFLKDATKKFEERQAATYYDAQWVYLQIADRTKDKSWLGCAEAAEKVYRDGYVMKSGGAVPGYWNFSRGLAEDYKRNRDEQSKKALELLATKGAFAADSDYNDAEMPKAESSRETAYIIHTYLNAAEAGLPLNPRIEKLVGFALGHLDQWFVQENAAYVRPFMVGLTAEALIRYRAESADKRILPALKRAAGWLWLNTWIPDKQCFKYTDRQHESGGMEPAPDLNLLVLPLYAWLYQETKDGIYLTQAKEIFAGGVKGSYLDNPKQFNQNYRLGFELVDLIAKAR